MGVSILYLIAVIPLLVGGILMIFDRKVVWWEWLGGVAAGLAVSAIMHACAVHGMTSDVETWSGTMQSVTDYPSWVEKKTFTTTDDKGHRHTHHVYVTHPEHWGAESTIGGVSLSRSSYVDLMRKMGGRVVARYEYKPDFDSGDHNVYVTSDDTGWRQPVTDLRHWSNRVKAAPSVFSFATVPDTVKVYPWPKNDDQLRSDRLIATPLIDRLEFDRMNSRLGPSKRVNVIVCGFGGADRSMARWQQAAWVGGKKNDLVICYGGDARRPSWVQVFGWSESDTCKYDIEAIVLKSGAVTSALPLIEREIEATYKAKDWSKFDYLAVEPQLHHYVILVMVMAVTQLAWWIYACNNEFDKDEAYRFSPREGRC